MYIPIVWLFYMKSDFLTWNVKEELVILWIVTFPLLCKEQDVDMEVWKDPQWAVVRDRKSLRQVLASWSWVW